MPEKELPQDADPSGMTDFEKNVTQEELADAIPQEEPERQKRGNRGPDEEPGFGQGA